MQQLLNPFAQKYPESNETLLPSNASCIRFNTRGPFAGHYIAAGNYDGTVDVWDVESGGVVRELRGHVKAVSSVCWSRNNRYLLSSALDSTCIIWDLSVLRNPSFLPHTPLTSSSYSSHPPCSPSPDSPQGSASSSNGSNTNRSHPAIPAAGQRVHTLRFDAPVADAVFHPRTSKIALVTLACNEVVLVDLRTRKGDGAAGGEESVAGAGINGKKAGKGKGRVVLRDVMEGEDDGAMDVDGAAGGETLCSAIFSPCGSRIYAGTTKGKILVIDPVTRYASVSPLAHITACRLRFASTDLPDTPCEELTPQVLTRTHVANSAIRQLSFDASGQHLITSATDRALRLLTVSLLSGLLTPSLRFQDAVNRTPWNAIGFSGDTEYVMGGAAHKAAHNVFVWDRESGVLVKVLEGPRESLGDCHWHPTRPIIASTTTSGDIALWQTSTPDNWAAFAPGFEELEENVEYDEREDEFDIEDEGEFNRRKDLEEDLDIDILAPDDSYPRSSPPIPIVQYTLDAYRQYQKQLRHPPPQEQSSTIPNEPDSQEEHLNAHQQAIQRALGTISNLPPTALGLTPGQTILNDQGAETQVGRAVRGAVEAYLWAVAPGSGHDARDRDGDGDDWEGFYLSLELGVIDDVEEE